MKRQILFVAFFSLSKSALLREKERHMRLGRFEAEAEAKASKSGRKDEDDEDEDLLLLPCWHSVARKLRVASARDAQKEVLRRAGWETCVLSCSPTVKCVVR